MQLLKIIRIISVIFFVSFSVEALSSRNICGTYYDDYSLPIFGYEDIASMAGYSSSFWNQAQSDFGLSGRWEQNDLSNSYFTGSRILAALWILKNAGDGNTPILDEAYDFAKRRIDRLSPECSVSWHYSGIQICSSSDDACNHSRGDNDVYLDIDALYSQHVLSIAALLYHEAKHSDQSWTTAIKKETHPGWPNGPYAYQVQWLAWFAANANPLFPEEFRKVAAYLARNLANRRGIPGRFTRSNTGDDSGYVYNPWVSRDSQARLPVLGDSACAHPNRHLETSNLGSVTEDMNKWKPYCGSCDVDTKTRLFPDNTPDYRYIEISCGIGKAGEIIEQPPYSYRTRPTPTPTPTPSGLPQGSACNWSASPSYSNGNQSGSYYEYPSIGPCENTLKKVTTAQGRVTVEYD